MEQILILQVLKVLKVHLELEHKEDKDQMELKVLKDQQADHKELKDVKVHPEQIQQ
jgi:hypothetical protein